MVNVVKHGIVLEKRALEFESEGVLNPAVIVHEGKIHMVYRAVRQGNFSTFGHCTLADPLTVDTRADSPILYPEDKEDAHGVEDPRLVCIDGLFYLSYSAYDGVNATGALATSTDLIEFSKQGTILPKLTYEEFVQLTASDTTLNEKYARYNNHDGVRERLGRKVLVWDKNLIFFPRRIQGRLYFLHRIKPDIQIASVLEISHLTEEFWREYFRNLADHILLTPRFKHEVSYIGGGCPPIETPEGWLMIYHAVHDTVKGFVYVASAALLDLENPGKVRAVLPYPLFKPDQDWEMTGVVANVCFPTGCIQQKGKLFIYYGAADASVACASVNLQELVDELLSFEKNQQIEHTIKP